MGVCDGGLVRHVAVRDTRAAGRAEASGSFLRKPPKEASYKGVPWLKKGRKQEENIDLLNF